MSSGIYNKHTGYHNRHSIRLRGYDYSQPGNYFITICIHNRGRRLFGDIVGGKMVFNEFGNIAHNEFIRLPDRFPIMKLDDFQIMPNHVHAVIPIGHVTPAGAPLAGAPSRGFNDQTHDLVQMRNRTVTPHHRNRLPNTHGYNSEPQHFGLVSSDSITGGRGVCDSDGANGETNGATNGAGASPAPTGVGKPVTLGDIVGAYKSLVANECLKIYKSRNEHMGKLWQRNYYDHIIRDNTALLFIRRYIRENTLHWIHDMEHHIAVEIAEFDMEEVRSGQ